LYSPISYVSDLKCSNTQDQTVNCHNGFCQLIRKGISDGDYRYVPEGKGANPSRIIIASNRIEEPDAEATFIYACNKSNVWWSWNRYHKAQQWQYYIRQWWILNGSFY